VILPVVITGIVPRSSGNADTQVARNRQRQCEKAPDAFCGDIGTIEASTSVENGLMTDRSAISRYLVSLFMSICVFAVVNFKYSHQAPCADCFAT
jgi:hypothetical protein